MARILSQEECRSKHHGCRGKFCDFPQHPDGCNDGSCLTCPVHCPCCTGHEENLCNQCPEEDCGNRNAPYDPSSVSTKEE